MIRRNYYVTRNFYFLLTKFNIKKKTPKISNIDFVKYYKFACVSGCVLNLKDKLYNFFLIYSCVLFMTDRIWREQINNYISEKNQSLLYQFAYF